MDKKIIQDFVQDKLQNEPTGHDYLHALRVKSNAMKLASNHLDLDVIYCASMIHDVIDHKLEEQFKASINDVSQLLIKSGLQDKQVQHVIHIIENMSFSSKKVPETIEGKIVQDADRLDAIGAIGIARTFSFGGKNNRLLYDPQTKNGNDTVSHFYQKLFHLTDLMNTKKAKKEAKRRTKFMRRYIIELNQETGGKS